MLLQFISGHPLVSVILFILALKWLLSRRCDLPGPWGLPFIGYLPFLGVPHETFTKLGKKYGEIFQVKAGWQTLVVLNSPSIIQEAFNNINLCGRPANVSLQTFADSGPTRFAFKPPDERWRFLRKCATKALSLFASSRNSKLENVVTDGLDTFYSQAEENANKPWDCRSAIFDLVAGVVGSILFGFEFDPKHPVLSSTVDAQARISEFVTVGSLMDNLPFGKYIFWRKRQRFLNDIEAINVVTEEHIGEHVYTGSDDEVRDISDALTKTAAEMPDQDKSKLGISDLHIRFISQDLFGAGFATTMDMLSWMLNLTAAHPAVEKKVHTELDSILGSARPELKDRARLHYVEAVLYESLRFSSTIPLSVPHAAETDVQFRGYFIPKGCTVFANTWGIHHDPIMFPEPYSFKPERFITDEGTVDVDLGAKLMPFSIGKRRCVGENLARQELAQIYTGIMQRFSIQPDPREPMDIHKAGSGFGRTPPRYKLIFSKRDDF